MAKERNSKILGGEVLEKAAETAKAEQYWILADKSEPRVPPKNFKYVEELAHLQIELIKMQEWVKSNRLRVCVIFEGRDAAGKGGVIKRITDPLNPRICRVVALSTPTEKERGQWYFQRYVAELPSVGEIVLFDRSWYNRAGVEHVMGFCTDEEYLRVPARLPAVRGDADQIRYHPCEILVLGERRGAGGAFSGAHAQPDQALEAQRHGR